MCPVTMRTTTELLGQYTAEEHPVTFHNELQQLEPFPGYSIFNGANPSQPPQAVSASVVYRDEIEVDGESFLNPEWFETRGTSSPSMSASSPAPRFIPQLFERVATSNRSPKFLNRIPDEADTGSGICEIPISEAMVDVVVDNAIVDSGRKHLHSRENATQHAGEPGRTSHTSIPSIQLTVDVHEADSDGEGRDAGEGRREGEQVSKEELQRFLEARFKHLAMQGRARSLFPRTRSAARG